MERGNPGYSCCYCCTCFGLRGRSLISLQVTFLPSHPFCFITHSTNKFTLLPFVTQKIALIAQLGRNSNHPWLVSTSVLGNLLALSAAKRAGQRASIAGPFSGASTICLNLLPFDPSSLYEEKSVHLTAITEFNRKRDDLKMLKHRKLYVKHYSLNSMNNSQQHCFTQGCRSRNQYSCCLSVRILPQLRIWKLQTIPKLNQKLCYSGTPWVC